MSAGDNKATYQILSLQVRLLHPPNIAVIGAGEGPELAALVGGAEPAWLRSEVGARRPMITIFDWNPISHRAMMCVKRVLKDHQYWRIKNWTGPCALTRFGHMSRISIALDGTRRRWERGVEAAVLQNEPAFNLVCHFAGGHAKSILDDLDVLAPLMDDRTIVAITGMVYPGPARAVRCAMTERGWHSLIQGDVALLSRPPVAVEQKESEYGDTAISA